VALTACGATGTTRSTGELDPWFLPKISWDITTSHYDVTSGYPGACVRVIWSDDTGQTLSEQIVQTDQDGAASGQVPDGAVRWEIKRVDCPDDEVAQPPCAERADQEYFFAGAPIMPGDQVGDDNLLYSFSIRASSASEADRLAEQVLEAGIGASVPPGVRILIYATMTAEPTGARLVQAQPDSFELWTLDFNQGAFRADLHDAARHAVGTWDVLEVSIPISAFDVDPLPGATWSNVGSVQYKTSGVPVAATARLRIEHQNG
jgi:hypothetical protein